MPELFDIKRSCTKLACLSKFEIQDGQDAMQDNLKIYISQKFYWAQILQTCTWLLDIKQVSYCQVSDTYLGELLAFKYKTSFE